MTTTSGASARALLRCWLRLRGAETDRFLMLSVCQWETTMLEGPHTSEPFRGDVAPQVSYLLTMS
jgi:hypothetical protein